jgi:hypothetical protein
MVSVLLGLAMAGMLLGALAGALVVTVLFFAISARRGDFALPQSWFVFVLGALLGGAFGAVLAPIAAFTPWRHLPIGRLFAHITIGTVIGGAVVALLFPQSLAFVLLGGLVGFLIAGDRLLASRSNQSAPAAEPHAPAG